MAIIKYPNELETAADAMTDTDLAGFYQPSTTAGVRKQKKNLLSTFKDYFKLAQNSRGLTSGRIDSQELVSGTLSISGWYTIAETDTNAAEPCKAEFSAVIIGAARQGSFSFRVATTGGGLARTKDNTYIEIIDRSANPVSFAEIGIIGARLAKSDSVANAGFKIQVNIFVSTSVTILTQIKGNIGGIGQKGFFLVTPVLENTPTLPDGVTAATFLEAGEELSFESPTFIFYAPEWSARVVSANAVDCCVLWPEISKQGTNLVITLPSTDLNFKESTINGIISGAHTISNFIIVGKHVFFRVTETGAFSALTVGVSVSIQVNGTGCKLAIT